MLNSFTSYVSYFEAGEDMTDEEYGQYMRAIHNFAYKDIEPDYSKLSPLVKAALRTVIASVRKNKEDRMNGKSGGRPSEKEKGVIEKEKGGVSEKEKGGYFFSETNVNVNEKENVKENDKGEESAPEPALVPAPLENISRLQNELFTLITEHNKSSPVESRIPISNNLVSFVQKECRELIEVMRGSSPAEIIATVQNLLKSAKEKRKKKYSWYWFLNDINDYKPGFFIDSTLPDKPKTVQGFYDCMKTEPRFKAALFLIHQKDWQKKGCPAGDEYYVLQDSWEVKNAS